MNKVSIIKNTATIFRNAIEQMEAYEFPNSSFFTRYPNGCCGDTSILLSKYFSEYGGIKAEYVWGMFKEQSHAWLEFEDYVIDITADQFSDINQKVIVTKDKSWYKKFRGKSRYYIDFEKIEHYNKNRLSIIYKNILKRISICTRNSKTSSNNIL